MIGSVWMKFQMEDRHLFFSGDFSRESLLLDIDPPGETLPVEIAENGSRRRKTSLSIIDNAYGMNGESQDQKLILLREFVLNVLGRGGHVLLPVPAFGRGQELLIWALSVFPKQKILAEQEVWDGLLQMTAWQDWLRPKAIRQITSALHSSQVYVPGNEDDRLSLLREKEALIIFTTDGMMESPRAKWYARRLAKSRNHAIIVTGHASEGTYAQRLLKGETEDSVSEVVQMGFKIHQRLHNVRQMMNEVPSCKTVLVHAPKSETDRVIANLALDGYEGVYSLEPRAVFRI